MHTYLISGRKRGALESKIGWEESRYVLFYVLEAL